MRAAIGMTESQHRRSAEVRSVGDLRCDWCMAHVQSCAVSVVCQINDANYRNSLPVSLLLNSGHCVTSGDYVTLPPLEVFNLLISFQCFAPPPSPPLAPLALVSPAVEYQCEVRLQLLHAQRNVFVLPIVLC